MEYQPEQLLEIVADLSRRYTSNMSTSVTYETAVQLMEAVCYCLQQTTEGFPTETFPLPPAKSLSPMEAYQNGYELVLKKTALAHDLYNRILPVLSEADFWGCLALKETIAYGIPQFFLRYDPRFCPQDHLLTLDYPVLPSLEHLKGVDRIYQYLLSVELEEEFFSCFSCDFVCTILKRSGGEYQNGFSNLALLLLDGLFRNQPFSSDSTSNQLSEALTFYLAKLQERFFPGNDRLFSYLSLAIPDLTAQFRNHIGNQEVSYEGCI